MLYSNLWQMLAERKTVIMAKLAIKYEDIRYKILTLLISSNLYSVSGSVRVKEDIEYTFYYFSQM